MLFRLSLPKGKPARFAHQELVDQTQARSAKHLPGLNAALLTGDEDVGTRFALGEQQVAVFFDHERRPERNHEEDPEQPTRVFTWKGGRSQIRSERATAGVPIA